MGIKGATGSQEEQGFNEKELEDIMSEIESLESEFDGGAEGSASAAEQPEEEEVEEVPVVVKKPAPAPARPKVVEEVRSVAKPAKVAPAPAPVKETPCGVPAQMEFHVQGDMQMNLKFYVGETWVQFSASPGEGLAIEMPGGMRFSVPLPGVGQKTKKAS
ncbi:MAG: hypothetical protein A2X86_07695 [Bdellovibrionales bacterium GWA2_49_15]|nr:MAG: hypothetical protein A2X86_07695 [Bdellovibrionales bacterium GWA2_49_15]HAZ11839.1 hypothetical protein [Bdellovibrionales bacterium]